MEEKQMKKVISTLIGFLFVLSTAQAQKTQPVKERVTTVKSSVNQVKEKKRLTSNVPKPQSINTVEDVDGNVYHFLTIGTQIWFIQNLRTTRYRNGEAISTIDDWMQWRDATTGLYCNYSDDANYVFKYGSIYNWYAVADSRGLCPIGWHVPSESDWNTLVAFLGGTTIAGYKLKSTEGWRYEYNGGNGDNSSGFSALPAASKDGPSYDQIDANAKWWSSTEYSWQVAYSTFVSFKGSPIGQGKTFKYYGFSVRCLKDN